MTADQQSGEENKTDDNERPLGEMFERLFPFYLSIGMTPTEYWDGEPFLAKEYLRAFEITRRHEEETMWRQGLYIYHAILDASPVLHDFVKNPKPLPYLKEPFPVSKKEEEERKERDEAAAYEEMKNRFRAHVAMSQNHDYTKKGEREEKDG